jgi:hypothetical protein
MIKWQEWFELARVARFVVVAAAVGLAFLTALTQAAEARGGHGFGRGVGGHGFGGGGMRGAASAGDHRRPANDAYAKSASDEEDKLLSSKLKSICRGC